MKLAIASDHGGFQLKKAILRFLDSQHIEYTDLGVSDEITADYPDYASDVARLVSEQRADAGVLLCGTGIGMAIVANKFKGVRAAVINDVYTAQMSKEHNDANVIALGGRVLSETAGIQTLKAWLDARFQGGRHAARLQKISALERQNFK